MSEKRVYAVKHSSESVIMKSSSGGAFTAISDAILERGGVIAAASYDYSSQSVKHIIAETKLERDAMRGSKYIESKLGNIYNECIKYIEDGRSILFVGTACQAAGLKGYIKSKGLSDEKVYICDIICHGTPPASMWKDYIEYFEKKHNMKIKYLNFRDKRNGWSKPYVYASDGKKEISTLDYVELFYSKAALNEKCYSCKYASLDRPGDITIGDFWGIERVMPDFYDEKGVSLVITNTEKGEKLFELAKASIVYRESNVNDCLQPNLCRPTEKSADRDKFLLDYKKHGIGYVIGKYTRTSFRGKLRFKIKYLLNGKRG